MWEESFWRGTVLIFAGTSAWGVGATSLAFTAVHYPRIRHITGFADVFLTAIALSLVYIAVGDILVIATGHWVRNSLILLTSIAEEGLSAC